MDRKKKKKEVKSGGVKVNSNQKSDSNGFDWKNESKSD